MEILIPGLILVGFMVWASTRIKRNAARAFEPEEIVTDEFTITKPEGYLAPVDPRDDLLFWAYSKEFGRDEAERVRRSTVGVSRFSGGYFDEICERAKIESVAVVSEQRGVIAERRCATIVVERSCDGVPVEASLKILNGESAVYQLTVTVLPEYRSELQTAVDTLLSSFTLIESPANGRDHT